MTVSMPCDLRLLGTAEGGRETALEPGWQGIASFGERAYGVGVRLTNAGSLAPRGGSPREPRLPEGAPRPQAPHPTPQRRKFPVGAGEGPPPTATPPQAEAAPGGSPPGRESRQGRA